MTRTEELNLLAEQYQEATETLDTDRLRSLGKGAKALGFTRTQLQIEIDKISINNQ